VAERLGVSPERVYDCISKLGNTSAASIPLALCEAVSDGSLRPSMRVLIGAVGAGLVWGATVVEWDAP
jgi:3-oxoacyl-[acyl-carrier-protein] synthase-3